MSMSINAKITDTMPGLSAYHKESSFISKVSQYLRTSFFTSQNELRVRQTKLWLFVQQEGTFFLKKFIFEVLCPLRTKQFEIESYIIKNQCETIEAALFSQGSKQQDYICLFGVGGMGIIDYKNMEKKHHLSIIITLTDAQFPVQ